MPQLIINADELGLCESTNRAIEACHRFGTVTSSTVIVNMWDFAGAVRIAKRNPHLGVGAHLNLTDGRPVCPSHQVPSLTQSTGHFLRRKELFRKILTGKVPMEEVRREWAAQLEKLDCSEIRLTHLDTHEHIHMIPHLARSLFEIARKRRLPVRNLKETFVAIHLKAKAGWLYRTDYWRRWARSAHFHLWTAKKTDIRMPKSLFSVNALLRDKSEYPSLKEYRKILQNLPPEGVSELMVHPGFADPTLEAFCQNGMKQAQIREQEFRILMNPEWKKSLVETGVTLENYGSLS